jgi:nucleotide-binding universal stress UspA family protein
MRIPPKKIISAIDFSLSTDTILSYSAALSQKYQATLFLVHVTTDLATLLEHNETALDVNGLQKSNTRDAQERLGDLAQSMPVKSEVFICQGTPADEIGRLARKQDADMVITNTHGKSGFKRLLIGSVTEKLMKTLHCPLLSLPSAEHAPSAQSDPEIKLKKILVGCDFSDYAKRACDYGLNLAQAFKAEMYLAHVIKPSIYGKAPQESRALRDRLKGQLEGMIPEDCREWGDAQTVVLDGEPYLALMEFAREQDIDIIVLGIRGHTLWEKLLVGSTTDRLIRQASLPVLAVR